MSKDKEKQYLFHYRKYYCLHTRDPRNFLTYEQDRGHSKDQGGAWRIYPRGAGDTVRLRACGRQL